jgi:recombination protein RecT
MATPTTRARNALATRAAETAPATTNGGNGGGKATIADLINRQRGEIARALPRHMDADRLARIATTTIKTTPQLAECTVESLLGALMLCAQTGLEPGPLAHAYLVPRRIKGELTCQWMLGYKGIIELARRSGQLTSIEAREVCENDEFDYEYGLDEKLVHRPFMGGDRGPLVAVWGLAKFKDGGHYFLVMSRADIDEARKLSDGAKSEYSPWSKHYPAMARKTVIRRMMPFLPLSAEQAAVVEKDESVNTSLSPDMANEPSWWDVSEVGEPDDSEVAVGEIVDEVPAGVDVETGEVQA